MSRTNLRIRHRVVDNTPATSAADGTRKQVHHKKAGVLRSLRPAAMIAILVTVFLGLALPAYIWWPNIAEMAIATLAFLAYAWVIFWGSLYLINEINE